MRNKELFAVLALLTVTGCKASVNVDAKLGDEQSEPAPKFEDSGAVATTPENSGPPIASYTGLRMLPTGETLVVVEVSRTVEVESKEGTHSLVYRLKGTRAPERVNRLPLISQHFPTRVSQVELRQAGENLDLVIDLRETGGQARHKTLETEGGMLLEVIIPRWRYADPDDPAQAKTVVDDTFIKDGRD